MIIVTRCCAIKKCNIRTPRRSIREHPPEWAQHCWISNGAPGLLDGNFLAHVRTSLDDAEGPFPEDVVVLLQQVEPDASQPNDQLTSRVGSTRRRRCSRAGHFGVDDFADRTSPLSATSVKLFADGRLHRLVQRTLVEPFFLGLNALEDVPSVAPNVCQHWQIQVARDPLQTFLYLDQRALVFIDSDESPKFFDISPGFLAALLSQK